MDDEKDPKLSDQWWALFRRVVSHVKPLYPLLFACMLGSMLAAALEAALPQVIRQAVDNYIMANSLPAPERLGGAMTLARLYAGMLVLGMFLRYFTSVGLNWVANTGALEIRKRLWEHFHRLPISYFDQNPVGRVVTRAANDTNAMAEVFTGVLNTLLSDLLILVVIWAALMMLSPKLCLLLMLLVPPLAWSSWVFKRESTRVNREIRVQLARLNAFLQESVQGLGVIKSFTAEELTRRRFEELNQEYYRAELRIVKLFAFFRPVFGSAGMVALALTLFVGGLQVRSGQMSLGSLVAYLFYLKMLFSPLDDLAEKFTVFQSSIIASERVFEILDTPVEPGSRPLADRPAQAPRARGEITFESVSFAYDPAKPVLKEVSFRVMPGQSVALVGPTGAGKTTITALLMRFYALGEHSEGRILVDGKPLEEWPLDELRAQIGLVQQELFLFRTDLARNVTLFAEASPEKVERAFTASRAIRVAQRFAAGTAQPVGERGGELSQGERQLLSFARALVIDPPILILDEATSSVDSKTEQAIQDALKELLKNRTSLVVAHRLSTIRQCDLILVLNRGEIAERGTHEQLMAKEGLYAHLYRTQMLEEAYRSSWKSTTSGK